MNYSPRAIYVKSAYIAFTDELRERIAELIGFDKNICNIKLSEHGFSISFTIDGNTSPTISVNDLVPAHPALRFSHEDSDPNPSVNFVTRMSSMCEVHMIAYTSALATLVGGLYTQTGEITELARDLGYVIYLYNEVGDQRISEFKVASRWYSLGVIAGQFPESKKPTDILEMFGKRVNQI